MDRSWFILNCRASLADHFLKGIDGFPEGVFDTQSFSASSAVLEISESGTRNQCYVVYPRESERKAPLTIRIPKSAEDIVSPSGRGILFRANKQNYHVFSNYKEGFGSGTVTYVDV